MKHNTLTRVNPGQPDDQADTYAARLAAASARVETLRETLAVEIERRDQLIVEWVDAGATNRQAARAAQLSEARVIAVLARS